MKPTCSFTCFLRFGSLLEYIGNDVNLNYQSLGVHKAVLVLYFVAFFNFTSERNNIAKGVQKVLVHSIT